MLKINKKFVTTKIGSCDHFLAKIKFSKPGKAENVSRVLVLVASLFTFRVPDLSSDVKSRNMISYKAEISTCKHSPNGALYVLLYILFHFCPSLFFSIFGLSLFFWDSLTFSFYFFDIFSSPRSTKGVTIENMSLKKRKSWPMENLEVMLKIDKNL